jgi:hypothetical protein
VSKEEASKRAWQVMAEAKLIWVTWGITEQGLRELARAGLITLRFRRRLEAAFFGPQRGESEEELQERSAKGRAAPSFYEPILQEERRDTVREVEEERQLAVA